MIGLTDAQQKILASLAEAIAKGDSAEVEGVFRNEDNDIQAVLSHKGAMGSHKDTILDYAIGCLSNEVKNRGEIGRNIEIIEQIWQKADQKTRDFVCDHAIESFQSYPGEINPSNIDTCPGLKEVIQEVEEHKKVKDLDSGLQEAIKSLDVEQVKAALEGCGEDIEKVLMRDVYWNNSTSIDYLLIFPLMVNYDRELNPEEIKKITKLLWDKASPNVRDCWLAGYMINKEGQSIGDHYIIHSLEKQQKKHANIAGEGWLEDLIQEVKNYKKDREMELSEPLLEEIEEKERIAQDDREIAEKLQFEQQDDDASIFSIDSEDNVATTVTSTNDNKTPEKSLPDDEKEDTVGATATPVNGGTASPVPTTGNKTPEKNDTNFWSEHKGKIALGGAGLCVAGAIAAYVLAYPAVALALAVLAAVILMGAGIAKVLEDPSVEKPLTQQQKV